MADALKGIKPLFKRGETFYYANRNTKQAEKCSVVDWICQYPMAYIAKNDTSGETFTCYHDFGCFIYQCSGTYPRNRCYEGNWGTP